MKIDIRMKWIACLVLCAGLFVGFAGPSEAYAKKKKSSKIKLPKLDTDAPLKLKDGAINHLRAIPFHWAFEAPNQVDTFKAMDHDYMLPGDRFKEFEFLNSVAGKDVIAFHMDGLDERIMLVKVGKDKGKMVGLPKGFEPIRLLADGSSLLMKNSDDVLYVWNTKKGRNARAVKKVLMEGKQVSADKAMFLQEVDEDHLLIVTDQFSKNSNRNARDTRREFIDRIRRGEDPDKLRREMESEKEKEDEENSIFREKMGQTLFVFNHVKNKMVYHTALSSRGSNGIIEQQSNDFFEKQSCVRSPYLSFTHHNILYIFDILSGHIIAKKQLPALGIDDEDNRISFSQDMSRILVCNGQHGYLIDSSDGNILKHIAVGSRFRDNFKKTAQLLNHHLALLDNKFVFDLDSEEIVYTLPKVTFYKSKHENFSYWVNAKELDRGRDDNPSDLTPILQERVSGLSKRKSRYSVTQVDLAKLLEDEIKPLAEEPEDAYLGDVVANDKASENPLDNGLIDFWAYQGSGVSSKPKKAGAADLMEMKHAPLRTAFHSSYTPQVHEIDKKLGVATLIFKGTAGGQQAIEKVDLKTGKTIHAYVIPAGWELKFFLPSGQAFIRSTSAPYKIATLSESDPRPEVIKPFDDSSVSILSATLAGKSHLFLNTEKGFAFYNYKTKQANPKVYAYPSRTNSKPYAYTLDDDHVIIPTRKSLQIFSISKHKVVGKTSPDLYRVNLSAEGIKARKRKKAGFADYYNRFELTENHTPNYEFDEFITGHFSPDRTVFITQDGDYQRHWDVDLGLCVRSEYEPDANPDKKKKSRKNAQEDSYAMVRLNDAYDIIKLSGTGRHVTKNIRLYDKQRKLTVWEFKYNTRTPSTPYLEGNDIYYVELRGGKYHFHQTQLLKPSLLKVLDKYDYQKVYALPPNSTVSITIDAPELGNGAPKKIKEQIATIHSVKNNAPFKVEITQSDVEKEKRNVKLVDEISHFDILDKSGKPRIKRVDLIEYDVWIKITDSRGKVIRNSKHYIYKSLPPFFKSEDHFNRLQHYIDKEYQKRIDRILGRPMIPANIVHERFMQGIGSSNLTPSAK